MARWRSRTASTIAGSGCTVPTSLFAYITETSTVSSRTAAAIVAEATTPCSSTGTMSTSKAEALEVLHRVQHGVVLDGAGDDVRAGPGVPLREGDALDCGVDALRPARGEHDLLGPRAEHGGDRLARAGQRLRRGAPARVVRRGVAEVLREQRQHRLERLGPHRRGGGRVEVDAAVGSCVRGLGHAAMLAREGTAGIELAFCPACAYYLQVPVNCYGVVSHDEVSSDTVRVITNALGQDNFEALLKMVAPGVQRVEESSRRMWGGGNSVLYRIPSQERGDALTLLESHRAPVVTAIDTDCDLSVCLDFYQHPPGDDPDGEWEPTALGDLVYAAKYRPGGRDAKAAVPECGRRVVSYVDSHPVLRQLSGVAAVPGSGSGVPSRLLTLTARAVSEAFGVPVVELRRNRTVEPQKNLAGGDDPDANQQGTMSAAITGNPSLVVVIDDLMRHGSTVREASRALREAGALRTASVYVGQEPNRHKRVQVRLTLEMPAQIDGKSNRQSLAVEGDRTLLDRPAIGLCGSRHADARALELAEKFGRLVAKLGLVLVSGNARGVDDAAQFGALEAGGTVISVLAEGLGGLEATGPLSRTPSCRRKSRELRSRE